jgi:hypothetical protein
MSEEKTAVQSCSVVAVSSLLQGSRIVREPRTG